MPPDVESTAVRIVVSPTQVLLRGQRTRTMVDRLSNGILLITSSGHDDGELAPLLFAELESEIRASARVTLFVDMTRVLSFSIAAREQWAQFAKVRRVGIQSVLVLVKSRLLEMALSVIGMIVGGGLIDSVNSEDQFVTAICKKVPALLRLPRYPQLEITAATG